MNVQATYYGSGLAALSWGGGPMMGNPTIMVSLDDLRRFVVEMEAEAALEAERIADGPWHQALCEPV